MRFQTVLKYLTPIENIHTRTWKVLNHKESPLIWWYEQPIRKGRNTIHWFLVGNCLEWDYWNWTTQKITNQSKLKEQETVSFSWRITVWRENTIDSELHCFQKLKDVFNTLWSFFKRRCLYSSILVGFLESHYHLFWSSVVND